MTNSVHQKFVDIGDCRLAYVERGQPSAARPTLMFVHATGFHSRVWDYHAEAFPEHHVIALDLRGHGQSAKLAVDHWRTFATDIASVVETLGINQVIGIGHSMGGHGLVEAADLSGAFARLFLLDPTIASAEAYAAAAGLEDNGEMHPAAKRRNRFGSATEFQDAIASKSSFPIFHPRIFRDYCHFGVEPDEGGGVRLCCEPIVEAHVYMAARSNPGIMDAVRRLEIPVTIVRAKTPTSLDSMDWASSPTWPELVHEFRQGTEHHWPDCTHFIPMERPDEVIELLQLEVDAWGG